MSSPDQSYYDRTWNGHFDNHYDFQRESLGREQIKQLEMPRIYKNIYDAEKIQAILDIVKQKVLPEVGDTHLKKPILVLRLKWRDDEKTYYCSGQELNDKFFEITDRLTPLIENTLEYFIPESAGGIIPRECIIIDYTQLVAQIDAHEN